MKVIVLKPTLVQDADGAACIATTNKVVEIEENRARHFINSGVVKLAPSSAELSQLERYEASAPVQAETEASAIGKAIARAIRDVSDEDDDDAPKIRRRRSKKVDEEEDDSSDS